MKKYIYQIDQSIKIEDTRKTSFVCLSNDKIYVSSISAKEKRELKLFFRKIERPVIFKIFTFSVLCAKLMMKAGVKVAEIDREYSGHEINIKSFIVQIMSIWKYTNSELRFSHIGKASRAHLEGYAAYKRGEKGFIVTAEEVLILFNLMNKA